MDNEREQESDALKPDPIPGVLKRKGRLSSSLRKILESRGLEAETEAGLDAVLEEGYSLTKEEAHRISRVEPKDSNK